MVTPLVMSSHAQRLRASPSSVSRPVAGRTARWQVDKEQHWPPTAPSGRLGAPFLQGFPRTPWCEGALSSNASAHPYLQLHLLHPGHLAGLLSGGFHQPPEFLSLRKLLAFMGLNTPGSDLENRAQHYLERFSYLELVELDDEDEEDWGGRAGDRVGHTDPASVQLGREHRLRTLSNTLTTSGAYPSPDCGACCTFRA
ncbi:uncharacterized protein LOC119874619 isoform X2 [Canis lupus familiaris]|uniref:uncharacterized protein LOC119874619 isoform X2 n=1 Tax=Canis lupus familiaris TaxID=9615 RepID=UPI0018F791E0|nr:uncharacterized protein LOC119874619 isoform X2 [Canis lupus familiaris]